MEAIQYLHGKNAKVSHPIQRIDGGYITTIDAPEGERQVVLTQFIDGNPLKYEEACDATNFGKAAADIHIASSGYYSNHGRYKLDQFHLVEQPLENILPFVSHRPDDIRFLESLSQLLISKYEEAESDKLDNGFCHGDFHGGNAHANEGDIYHFDFDCCGLGLRVFDLATFKWSSRLLGKEEDRWPLFLEGYRSKRPVEERELGYIEEFVAMRDLWLFGLHTGMSKDAAKGWINDTYIDRRMNFLKDALQRIEKNHEKTDIPGNT